MTIPIPRGTRVWLATGHTDMHKGFDGLALLVQETLNRNPHNGHLFVFRGRRGGLIKVLWHDGQGMCLFSKRLERGRFIWPSPADGTVAITPGAARLSSGRHRLAPAAAHEAITQPPAPSHPIARGRAGPGLIAQILSSKYGLHLPLNRQSAVYAREGVDLDVSTLADWVGAAAATLMPLVLLIRAHVFAAERIHTDDTTLRFLPRERPELDGCGPMSAMIGRLAVLIRRPSSSFTPWIAVPNIQNSI